MKRALWIPLVAGMLLGALGLAGCIRERPAPAPKVARSLVTATATRAVNVVVPQVTNTRPPTATPRPTQANAPETQPTTTPASVDVVDQPTAVVQPQPTARPASNTPATAAEISYQVRWGDTLSQIARRYGSSVNAIMERNPQIVDRDRVSAGTLIVVPAAAGATGGTPVARETGDYVVQRGDTLAGIARRFGTTIAALMEANPSITNMDYVQAGRHLVIPVGGESTAPRVHLVVAGETLWSIARRYNTTVWAIMVRNDLANGNLIYAGQKLIIP